MNSKEMMNLPSQKESLYMSSRRTMMAGLRESQREEQLVSFLETTWKFAFNMKQLTSVFFQ